MVAENHVYLENKRGEERERGVGMEKEGKGWGKKGGFEFLKRKRLNSSPKGARRRKKFGVLAALKEREGENFANNQRENRI